MLYDDVHRPEKRLFAAVLESMLLDIRNPGRLDKCACKREWRGIQEYLYDDGDHVGSLIWICHLLQLKTENVKRIAKKLINERELEEAS